MSVNRIKQKMIDGVLDELQVGSIDPFGFWTPPTQPSTAWGVGQVPTDRDPEGVIQALYEPLRMENPDYITRDILGPTTVNASSTIDTGEYSVYRYILTPKNYSKTMIFSAGTHGNEYTAFFGLWRFIYHLVNDWETYPQLRYIRQNVRIVVLPMINPWSFRNNKRQNANLVDLNRNTDYLWQYITSSKFQVGGANYKGPAPFSELETQYFRDTVTAYSDAIASIDFHTITTVAAEHIVYTPRYISQHRQIFDDVIEWLNAPGHRMVNGTSAVPTLSCWAADTFGMTVANPEWYNGLWSSTVRGETEMTEAVKYFGNIMIEACKLTTKGTHLNDVEKWTKYLIYDKKTTAYPMILTATVFNNFPIVYEWKPKRQGAFKVRAKVRFTISAPCTVSFNPTLYQSYHPEMSWTNTKDADTFTVSETYTAAGTYQLDMWAGMHCFPTNHNETGAGETQRTAEAKFRLRGKSTAGSVTIERFRAELTYEPGNRGRLVEHIDYTGTEVSGGDAVPITAYPDPAKYVDDMVDDD